jgi:predicted nuclease of predicted toxin-antitoxin system
VRVKLDENVPMRTTAPLAALGHDVDTVVDEGLAGTADDALWPHVQEAARFLVTRDLGFSDARRYPPGTHQGILVLRLSDDSSAAVAARLATVFAAEEVERWTGALVVVTDHKVRVRRPPFPIPRSARR